MSMTLPISNTLHLRTASAAQTSSDVHGAPSASMNSTDILRGQKAVEINHNGSTYRLQATRLGKLILTK